MSRWMLGIQTIILALVGWVAYSQWISNSDLRARGGVNAELREIKSILQQQPTAVHESLASQLRAIDSRLALQSSAIGSALGTTIPFQLSEEAEEKIKSIEDELSSEAKWPKTSDAVQKLNDRLANVLAPLPPWAQDALLPRLLPRRWEIHTLWILRQPLPEALDELLNFQNNVESHLAGRPDGASAELGARLRRRGDETAKAVQAATLSAARTAMQEKDVEKATVLLGSYAGENDEKVKGLRADVKKVALQKSLAAAAEEVRRNLNLVPGMSDLDMKEYAVARVRQDLMEMRLRSVGEMPLDRKLSETFADLEKASKAELASIGRRRSEEHANRVRDYQVKALSWIRQVRTLADIKKTSKSAAPNKEPEDLLADEMIKWMSPIDKSLLDVAVYQWFQMVYTKRLDELDEKNQIRVVTEFAKRPKVSLE